MKKYSISEKDLDVEINNWRRNLFQQGYIYIPNSMFNDLNGFLNDLRWYGDSHGLNPANINPTIKEFLCNLFEALLHTCEVDDRYSYKLQQLFGDSLIDESNKNEVRWFTHFTSRGTWKRMVINTAKNKPAEFKYFVENPEGFEELCNRWKDYMWLIYTFQEAMYYNGFKNSGWMDPSLVNKLFCIKLKYNCLLMDVSSEYEENFSTETGEVVKRAIVPFLEKDDNILSRYSYEWKK